VALQLDSKRVLELLRGPYARTIRDLVGSYTTPFFWTVEGPHGTPTIPGGGTAFFVDTGQTKFGVTADHVIVGLEQARSRGRCMCQLLNLQFDPLERIIDRHRDIDIATFELRPKELTQVGDNKQFMTLWPPRPPEIGKGLVLFGYPSKERKQRGSRAWEFGIYQAGLIASEVSPTGIRVLIERDRLVDTLGSGLPEIGYPVGGMSGGPAMAMFEGPGDLITYRLSGVIYEKDENTDRFWLRRADVIRQDGTLDRSLWKWSKYSETPGDGRT